MKISLALMVMLLIGLPALAQDPTAEPEPIASESALAMLQNTAGEEVGQVMLTNRGDGKILVQAMIESIEPGFHGFHIHTVGECDPAGDPPFSSAGGHLNLTEAAHDDHAGDLPTLLVMADGSAEMILVTDRFVMADLFDEDGSAIMIHANADNFANIPERYGVPDEDTLKAGDSGDRVACGVLDVSGS